MLAFVLHCLDEMHRMKTACMAMPTVYWQVSALRKILEWKFCRAKIKLFTYFIGG